VTIRGSGVAGVDDDEHIADVKSNTFSSRLKTPDAEWNTE